jgi:AraC-like DNA-binding protein
MRMDHALTYHRVRLEPVYVFGILSRHAEQLLDALERSKTLRGRVESLLMPILHMGAVGVDAIAAKVGLSRQALYRGLKTEGVTFAEVLDALRHSLALHYLESKRISVHETAYLVGFCGGERFLEGVQALDRSEPA